MEIVYDGGEACRLAKVQKIVQYPEIVRNLNVCWFKQHTNCGHCEKCRRTAAEIRTCGELHKYPDLFESPLDLKKARYAVLEKDVNRVFYREMLALALETGEDKELIRYLRGEVTKKYNRGLWKLGRASDRSA